MLARLPVELLKPILRFAAPLDYTPELYKERRKTLRSCCLVNSTLRELAQPMLPEVFAVEREEDVELVKALGPAVKLLVVDGGEEDEHLRRSARRAIRACPEVHELRVRGWFELDLGGLLPITSLRRLVIVYCRLVLDSPLSLPTLTEISLCGCYGYGNTLRTLLIDSTLPSLAALGLRNVREEGHLDYYDSHLPCLTPDFLRRLDAFVTDAKPYHYADTAHEVFLPTFNLGQYSRVWWAQRGSALAFCLFDEEVNLEPFTASREQVKRWLEIEDHLMEITYPHPSPESTNLALLFVPEPLRLENLRIGVLRTSMSDMLAACHRRGVEVEYYSGGANELDSVIPPGFWRRSRRLKREQEGRLKREQEAIQKQVEE
ncbi:hypothetical protein JCM10213_008689 [Rhodosporidiobolus nylandii]